jgi:predicted metal-dependent phosphoesterase TrpH
MLKVELHAHTSDDPIDQIPYTAEELIDRAAALGYGALAITLHDRQHPVERLIPYAAERGVVLLPGIERTIQGRHVLLINFRRGTEQVNTFEDLRRLKRREPGLVVAPHPFFPASTCLMSDLDRYRDLFDAIEINAMFTASLNFNRRAERWAARSGKPLVGNCDVHRLRQLGSTYSLVDAKPDPESICQAIRDGRVHVESRPLSWIDATSIFTSMVVGQLWKRQIRRASQRPSLDNALRIEN